MSVTSVVKNIVSKVEESAPFGKFERITAGFCMAIPFFLMIVDPSGAPRNRWLLTIPLIIVVLPQLIRVKDNEGGKSRKNDGMIITVVGAVAIVYTLLSVHTDI